MIVLGLWPGRGKAWRQSKPPIKRVSRMPGEKSRPLCVGLYPLAMVALVKVPHCTIILPLPILCSLKGSHCVPPTPKEQGSHSASLGGGVFGILHGRFVSSYALHYNLVLLCFDLFLKLLCLVSGNHFDRLLSPFDMPLSFIYLLIEHVLTFWLYDILQAHLEYFLFWCKDHPFLQGAWFFR